MLLFIRSSLLLAALAASLPAHAARRGDRAAWPEPLRRHVQIVLVEELEGQILRINDVPYFVHQIEMARTSTGEAAYLSYDLEDATGERFVRRGTLADLPEGSVRAHGLDDAFGLGGRMLWWADGDGEVHAMNLEPGEIVVGEGGLVSDADLPPRCTLAVRGYCAPEDCEGTCERFPSCKCIGWNGQSRYMDYCPARGGESCVGSCGRGECRKEPVLGGCTCQ